MRASCQTRTFVVQKKTEDRSLTQPTKNLPTRAPKEDLVRKDEYGLTGYVKSDQKYNYQMDRNLIGYRSLQ